MSRNKIIPIGEANYDEERRTLTLPDGVIEEDGKREFIDTSARTYVGVTRNDDGSYNLPGIYTRERSEGEKRADLENMLRCLDRPSIKNPIAFAKHAYNNTVDYIRWKTTQIKREIRKIRLEKELNKRNIDVEEDLLRTSLDYETHTLYYVWDIVTTALDQAGEDSELFDEVAGQLLTKRERKKVMSNLAIGEHPRWGIATVEDRRYKIAKVTALYKKAKELAERFSLSSDWAETLKKDVESSPFYALVA